MEYKKITTCITSFNLWSKQEDDSHALSHIPKNSWTIVTFLLMSAAYDTLWSNHFIWQKMLCFSLLSESVWRSAKNGGKKKQSKRSDLSD